MQKYIASIFSVLVLAFMTSCSDSSEEFASSVVNRADVETTPGFTWFEMKVSMYSPNADVVAQIADVAGDTTLGFYFFAAPACSCDSLQDIFPNTVKCLDNAGIGTSRQHFVAMLDETAENPLGSEIFRIDNLPEIFIAKNGLPVYSFADSFRVRNSAANLNPLISKVTVEEMLLEALQSLN